MPPVQPSPKDDPAAVAPPRPAAPEALADLAGGLFSTVVPFPAPLPAPDDAPDRPPHLTIVPEAPPAPPPASGPAFRRASYVSRRRLGEILIEMGAVDPAALGEALIVQRSTPIRLGQVLLRRGLVDPETLARALGRQHAMGDAGPAPVDCPASDALAARLPADVAMRHRILPWRRMGPMVLIATSDPERLESMPPDTLPEDLRNCVFAVVPDAVLDARIMEVHGTALARAAECRVSESMSCRLFRDRSGAALITGALALLVAATAIWPATSVRVLTLLGLVVTLSNVGLRLAAWWSARRAGPGGLHFSSVRPALAARRKLPTISILVPLHREPDIAGPLTQRLSRLDYPRELLEVALVVEEDDAETLHALARADLPPWMRVIPVPDGHPRTKPRAMNYALNFVTGDVVGVYDAEDAPAPDQLLRVAARFAAAPYRVACLQGALDYYNPTRNWMSRCFTIEYANWFRMVLPGIARMGLVVPLGGTTLFFRRQALESVGGWDSHNVTEDADLGVRLARRGYRTELIETTTLEEANASPWPWVKQRSRWMKGYILTWAVHTRRPVRLWRELGPRRFAGFQLMFLGAILDALLMPLMWSMIVLPFGLWHPIVDWLPGWGTTALGAGLVTVTAMDLAIAMAGCSSPHHRGLRTWVPTMKLYFPLATLAVTKALIEIAFRPFHWDKTAHGAFGGTAETGDAQAIHETLQAPPLRMPRVGGAVPVPV